MIPKQLLAQFLYLLGSLIYYTSLAVLYTPLFLLRNIVLPSSHPKTPGVVFYEGVVTHDRKKPKKHAFRFVCSCGVMVK